MSALEGSRNGKIIEVFISPEGQRNFEKWISVDTSAIKACGLELSQGRPPICLNNSSRVGEQNSDPNFCSFICPSNPRACEYRSMRGLCKPTGLLNELG
jgi:hypothetical protein